MRFYRALLRLYPASFRAEYGEEMCAIFARRKNSWLASFFEVLLNAAAVHWDILRQDLRYTARTLWRTPGFTLVAILVVALGIGANTAVFSVVDYVLIRPLPFHDSDRLVKLWEHPPGYARTELSPADYRDWKRMNTVFAGMGALVPASMNLVGQGDPERVEACLVTADVLPLLGVQPLIGRVFTEGDDRDGAPGTVILSYRLWQAVLGGDAGVLGRKLILDGMPFTVIGIMPAQFHFPNQDVALWTPMQFQEAQFADRNNDFLQGIARLRPGVSLAAARTGMALVTGRLARQYPKENGRTAATVNLLRDEISDRARLLLRALLGAAACVLLIACTNLANLLLARALGRQKELAVRTAMGAGRERLVRQLVTESMVLAVLGGVVGVLVAIAAVPLLTKLVPNSLPMSGMPSLDLRVLSFAGLLTAVTGIAFGAAPALRVCRDADPGGLRDNARAGGGRKVRLRSALVLTGVTFSMVLLISAGLLLRALWKIQGQDPGFRVEGVLTLRTPLPMPKYAATARRADFYRRVISGVEALPGVTRAAYISFLPMVMGGGIWPVDVDGKTLDPSRAHTASMRFITPGFFATLRIPLHAGRDVSQSDTGERRLVAVVSDSLARRYWPGENPIGRRFKFGLFERTVVGVVGDIRVRGLEGNSEPQVYLPYQQVPDGYFSFYSPKDLVVRSAANVGSLLPAIRRIIRNADPEQPIANVRTLARVVQEDTAPRSVQVRVIGAFAALAFLLAGIGIHGLLSFTVSSRKPEIGVRIALGAQRGHILRMVMLQGVRLAAMGVSLGLALAYASARAMQALLGEVTPGDAVTFGTAAALGILMTFAGSLAPAWRALRIDPITAIRAE